MSAFEQGKRDFDNGWDISDNPHDKQRESGHWQQWRFGWFSAYAGVELKPDDWRDSVKRRM